MKDFPKLSKEWVDFLPSETFGPNWERTLKIVDQAYRKGKVYPAKSDIFRVFDLVKPIDVKVVVLGQDPYHGPGQANGIAFSVQKGITKPPSLKNIFKEIKRDLNIDAPHHGDLSSWASQGVLLLNSVLTVDEGRPGSHSGIGWEIFTNQVVESLSKKDTPKVFMLWGNTAQAKEIFIQESPFNLVLKTSHPSPLSFNKGFNGCMHFSIANAFLRQMNRGEINWSLNP